MTISLSCPDSSKFLFLLCSTSITSKSSLNLNDEGHVSYRTPFMSNIILITTKVFFHLKTTRVLLKCYIKKILTPTLEILWLNYDKKTLTFLIHLDKFTKNVTYLSNIFLFFKRIIFPYCWNTKAPKILPWTSWYFIIFTCFLQVSEKTMKILNELATALLISGHGKAKWKMTSKESQKHYYIPDMPDTLKELKIVVK